MNVNLIKFVIHFLETAIMLLNHHRWFTKPRWCFTKLKCDSVKPHWWFGYSSANIKECDFRLCLRYTSLTSWYITRRNDRGWCSSHRPSLSSQVPEDSSWLPVRSWRTEAYASWWMLLPLSFRLFPPWLWHKAAPFSGQGFVRACGYTYDHCPRWCRLWTFGWCRAYRPHRKRCWWTLRGKCVAYN